MFVYYVQPLYILIVLKKLQKHIKIIFIRDQKQNKKFCEDENNQFHFLGTKIKIHNIYRTKNLFNPVIL